MHFARASAMLDSESGKRGSVLGSIGVKLSDEWRARGCARKNKGKFLLGQSFTPLANLSWVKRPYSCCRLGFQRENLEATMNAGNFSRIRSEGPAEYETALNPLDWLHSSRHGIKSYIRIRCKLSVEYSRHILNPRVKYFEKSEIKKSTSKIRQ